jgi:cytidylyltransferase family
MNNLVTRAITGTLFLLVVIGCIIGSALSFTLLFALITGVTVWEFGTNVNNHTGANINRLISTTAGVYLFFSFAFVMSGIVDIKAFIPYLLTILYLPISELYLKDENPLRNWAYAFASQLYIALPFSMLIVLSQFSQAIFSGDSTKYWVLPLSVFIFIWTSDTGAYCCGSLLHKRFPAKLFERVSPNKSWVGSIGGGVFCLIAAVLLKTAFGGNMTVLQWMGLALTVCVFGTWGDLVESLFKRQLGIKDSGNILPGHGGMLDRFDSALLAIPAATIYLYSLEAFCY